MKNYLKSLLTAALLLCGMNMWSADYKGSVAVVNGKGGTAKVKVYVNFAVSGEAETTSTAKQTVSKSTWTNQEATYTYTATSIEGYSFSGWYSDASGNTRKSTSNPYEFTNKGNGDYTYYAKFSILSPTFEITDLNCGSCNVNATTQAVAFTVSNCATIPNGTTTYSCSLTGDYPECFIITKNNYNLPSTIAYKASKGGEQTAKLTITATYKNATTKETSTVTKTVTIKGTGIKLNQNNSWTDDIAQMAVGATKTLNNAYTYTSSNTAIVSVNGNVITAEAEGEATITAHKAGDDVYNNWSSEAKSVTVVEEPTEITEKPTASAITYGQPLSAATLIGGSAAKGGQPVSGTFAFKELATILDAGTNDVTVVFTPSDGSDELETTIQIMVNKQNIVLTVPTIGTLGSGDIITPDRIIGGSAKGADDNTTVEGYFTTVAENVSFGMEGDYNVELIFLPNSANYNTNTITVSVHIDKAQESRVYVVDKGSKEYSGKLGGNTEEIVISTKAGVAGTLYFDARKQGACIDPSIQVQQYVNESWGNVGTKYNNLTTDYKTYSVTLNENATKIRFNCAGSINNYIKNVKVSRKTYLNTSDLDEFTKEDGSALHPGETAQQTLTIDWSCANGGDLQIVSSDPLFSVSPSVIQNVNNNDGETQVVVTFTGCNTIETDATITIYNDVYTKVLNVKGISQPVGSHTRSMTEGVYGPICLPGDVEDLDDEVEFYEATSYEEGVLNFTRVQRLEAGKAYIFNPKATKEVTFDFDIQVTEADQYGIMIGNLSEEKIVLTAESNAAFLNTKDNKIYFIGGTARVSVGQYKAYFNIQPVDGQASAPIRILNGSTGTDTATSLDDMESSMQSVKFYENGQLLIRTANGVFNMMGQKVR